MIQLLGLFLGFASYLEQKKQNEWERNKGE